MYPRLFTIGPITVYSFGLMMGIGFFVASLVLHKETVRKSIAVDFSNELLSFLRSVYIVLVSALVLSYVAEYGIGAFPASLGTKPGPSLMITIGILGIGYLLYKKAQGWATADTSAFIVVVSIITGIAGSKLLYVLENISYVGKAPFEMIFSPGGLTFYGGFFLTTVTIYYFSKRRQIPFLKICDAASPALMIGYGIARLGCHLAGDGDYGVPTDLPWASVYSNGTYPPSIAFRDFPDIVKKYGVNGVVPDTIPVHPAPVYEFLAGIILFGILWKFRSTFLRDGQLFMLYLMLAGGARLSIEFVRINPRIMWGLSEAQLFSIGIILAGFIGMLKINNSQPTHISQIHGDNG